MNELLEHVDELKYCLTYLDISENLEVIKNKCLSCNNLETDISLYNFVVKVSPCDLLEISASLGNTLLNNPTKAERIFQEVIYHVIKSLNLLPGETDQSQISVTLRLQSLPAIKDLYHVTDIRDLTKFQITGGFLSCVGVVSGLSAVSSYTQSTGYVCPVEGCIGQDGKNYIRVHVPGAAEGQTVRKDFHCFHCGMVLEEDKSKRVLAEKVIAELVPVSVFRAAQWEARRTQTIPVYLRDDLVSMAVIGEQCRVFGLVRTDFGQQSITLAVEANNIEKVSPWDLLDIAAPSPLPKCVSDLYHDNIGSPWSFVRCLAFLFAGTISTPGSFYRLKLAMLLSLVLAGRFSENSPQLLHILACGKESALLDRLFRYGCSLTDRAITHNSCDALTGRITKDRYQNSNFFVEAGSLSLASGGVCNVGDLGRFKKQTRALIQSTLETGHVVIDVASKFSQGLPQQHSSPLSCQVWAFSDTTSQRSAPGQDELFITGDTGQLSKALVDLVLFTDFNDTSVEIEEEISYEILHQAMDETSCLPPIPAADFQKYLELARGREVKLTPAAEVLLQGYYQASRRMRANGSAGATVPVSTLPTLYAVSLAHAKLSLRDEVTESDAVLAICLYEESITARYGFSILSVRPQDHISLQQFSQTKLDEELYRFHGRLVSFCGGEDCPPGPEE